MKHVILILSLCLCTVIAWAKPSLVLMDKGDLKVIEGKYVVIREMSDDQFVAVELADVQKAGVYYKLIDEEYTPNHYVLVRGPRLAHDKGLPVLWEDEGGGLVKLPTSVNDPSYERCGGESPLEKPVLPSRNDERTALDDPALDAWLTTLGTQVNADTLFNFVSTLASWNRFARYATNDTAADWIRNKFLAYGLDSVYYHNFTASGSGWTRTDKNIIGVLTGTVYPDSVIIIGGHMDATSQTPATAAPGADDNGTGTSAVVEAARLLSPYSFTRTIMFVAFNAEEQGLQGSAALANAMAASGRHVIGLLNMDMIGYYQAGGSDLWLEGFRNGTNSMWLTTMLWDNCVQFTDLVPYLYPQEGYGSDHESFHDAGFVAVLSIESEYEDYACYHNTCDLPAQINSAFMRKMALVNILTCAEIAVPQGSGSISGNVTLEGTADYSGVAVSVLGGSGSTMSGAGGTYQISSLMSGTYSLVFSKAGWVNDTLTGIVVTNGNVTSGQNVFLSTSLPGSISGTITVSGGTGSVMDAIVYINGTVVRTTNAGTYLFSPVMAGQRVVTAALDGYVLASTTVTLADGEQMTGVNLTLYPQWDLEASNYNLNNNSTGWTWGTDAVAGSHSATRVWGTVLGGNYVNCTDYKLDMPAVCLANLDSVKLTFWHWYNIEPNGPTRAYDGANVSVAPLGTENWQVVVPVGGYGANAAGTCNPIQNQAAYAGVGTTWRQASFNLNAFIGQTVKIRFRLGADQGTVNRGWYLDDISLAAWHSYPESAPDMVDDLVIMVAGADIQLNWNATAGAVSYKIYRGTSFNQTIDDMTLLSTQTGASYVDINGTGFAQAFYVVVAIR